MDEIKKYLFQKIDQIKRPWLTVNELVEIFEMSHHTLYNWIEEGQIDGRKTSGKKGTYRVSKESVIKKVNQDYQEEVLAF